MGLGGYALELTDAGLRKAGLLPDRVMPEARWTEYPVVRAFTVRYPTAIATSIQRFYDQYEVNQRYYTSYMARAKEGDIEAMQRIQAAGGGRIFLQLDQEHRALGEHHQAIRNISRTPYLSASDKRQLIDTLLFRAIEIAQGGLQTMRRFDDAAQQQQQQPRATGMTPLEQLRAAGFSEQEIGQWAGEQRSTLQQAGFADAEIDHYLAGPKGR